VHCGHVTVVDPEGVVVAAVGDPDTVIYPRSAVKPFQAAAVVSLLDAVPDRALVAIMAASHTGSAEHQAHVRRVLQHAAVPPSALQCPPAAPAAEAARDRRAGPTRVAHNCSGKHAGFLWATNGRGGDPAAYLSPGSDVQRAVRRHLRRACGVEPRGPGVDGCGAPAWRLPLRSLALGFARLAVDDGALAAVAAAMRAYPQLVGGAGVIDTVLMRSDPRVLAKRGADGVLGIAVAGPRPVGVAIKVSDGAARARGPIATAVLGVRGIAVPDALARPPVLGGGVRHGTLKATSRFLQAIRT
jgi:L-asparaginase II